MIINAIKQFLSPAPHKKLFRQLRRGDIAVDCGANVGKITAMMAAGGATVYAFEPNPHAFAVLRKRFEHDKNVTCIQKAVWIEATAMKLFLHQNSAQDEVHWSTGSSMLANKSNVDRDKFVDVETVDLAAFMNTLGAPVKLLKVDIEGAECEVVTRLIEQDLHRRTGAILVETHDHKMQELKPATDRLRGLIARQGITNIHLDWI